VLIIPSAWGSQLTGYNHHHQLHASHQVFSGAVARERRRIISLVNCAPSNSKHPTSFQQPSVKGGTNDGQDFINVAENQIIFGTTPTAKGANASPGKSYQVTSPVFDATPNSNKVSPPSGKYCASF
jgi:hypothetical protein